jgi:CelD/BcsL family acetyltransferase involved in cellulose biosynthesis
MLKVSEINDLAGLAPLRGAWRELLAVTPGYSLFQTLDWLEETWDHYPLPQKLRAVVLERDGAPVGIVPLCVRTERRKLGALRVLTYPLNDWGTFYGPVGPDPTTAIAAAIGHVAATPRDWDLIDLRWVDQDAAEFMAVGEALRSAGFDFRARPRMEVRITGMADGWEKFVAGRSRNWRRQMRTDLAAIETIGEVSLIRHRPLAGANDPAIDADVYETCASIAEKSWQAADPAQSTLSSPRVRDVLKRVHLRAASLGMLDTNILAVGGKPVAFNYNYFADGRAFGLRCGFDQTAGMDNCGKILIYKMLQDAFERGDVEYSFGPGRQPYKDRFATEMRCAYTFRHFARGSLRSQLMNVRERLAARFLTEQQLVERSLVS